MRGPPQIFDRKLYSLRRARASGTDFLVGDAAAHLAERIRALKPAAAEALDLNSRDEAFAFLRPVASHWSRTSPVRADGVVSDEEALPFARQSFDLITSILSLHAVNDVPGVLIQIRQALREGGRFVGAMFGGETLRELRAAFAAAESDLRGGASPRVLPFADVRDLGALLQRAGFGNPVADVERTTVRYREFAGLTRDLRALGETNMLQQRSRKFLRRDVLSAAMANYRANNSDESGRLLATFDVIYLTGTA
ncbi:MAG TPA: methyltransferase domain-containing protein [Rhizomicrobium sp.]|jgi:SAM-dependent methyltransferase